MGENRLSRAAVCERIEVRSIKSCVGTAGLRAIRARDAKKDIVSVEMKYFEDALSEIKSRK